MARIVVPVRRERPREVVNLFGEVPERPIGPVSKTGVAATSPRVRIPPSPLPYSLQEPGLRPKPRRERGLGRASCAPLCTRNPPPIVACCRILSHVGCAIGVCAGVCAGPRLPAAAGIEPATRGLSEHCQRLPANARTRRERPQPQALFARRLEPANLLHCREMTERAIASQIWFKPGTSRRIYSFLSEVRTRTLLHPQFLFLRQISVSRKASNPLPPSGRPPGPI